MSGGRTWTQVHDCARRQRGHGRRFRSGAIEGRSGLDHSTVRVTASWDLRTVGARLRSARVLPHGFRLHSPGVGALGLRTVLLLLSLS